jgi:hypothetical protein
MFWILAHFGKINGESEALIVTIWFDGGTERIIQIWLL